MNKEIDVDALASMMGEENFVRPRKVKYPIVRLNGTKGKFQRLDVEKEKYSEPKDVGQMFEGVIIGVRSQLGFISVSKAKGASKGTTKILTSSEYDLPTDRIRVWESINGSTSVIGEGTPAEMREKIQSLRSKRILYMVVGDEIVQFQVKGSGLGYLFEYINEVQDKDMHLFEMFTRVEPVMETAESGMQYYAAHFVQGKRIEGEMLGKVAIKLEAFHDNLKKLRERYAKQGWNKGVNVVEESAGETEVVIDDSTQEPLGSLEDAMK